MKKLFVYIILIIFLLMFAVTSAIINDPHLPNIQSRSQPVTPVSSGGGGNVTSVTSSTNCITVNPTIGSVSLTFNSSCASGLEVFTDDLVRNFSIIYFSNNTNRWESLNKTPGNNNALVFCTGAGLSWIDNTAGICPL